MTGHVLTIGPGTNGYVFHGHLLYTDGTEEDFWADERARIISKAQMAIEQRQRATEVQRETLLLDDFGEILREPDEHSVRVQA